MLASITNDPKRQKSEMICKNLKTTNKSEMGITNPTPILEILFANYQNNSIHPLVHTSVSLSIQAILAIYRNTMIHPKKDKIQSFHNVEICLLRKSVFKNF